MAIGIYNGCRSGGSGGTTPPSTLGTVQGWAWQDFPVGNITGTNVVLSENHNGTGAVFDSTKIINNSTIVVQSQYPENKVYTGSTKLFSQIVSSTGNTLQNVTLSGIPHVSWGNVRIYYLYIYENGLPSNYTLAPKSVSSQLLTEIDALFITEEELDAVVNVDDLSVNQIIYYNGTKLVGNNALTFNGSAIDLRASSDGVSVFQSRVNGDTFPRFSIDADGTIAFGDGVNPQVTVMDRGISGDNVAFPGGFTIDNTISISSILDEDDMASNSDTAIVTQQSIVAYVTNISGQLQSQIDIISGGSSTFIGLVDSPNSYTNKAGEFVVVNNTEDGVEFIPLLSGKIDLDDINRTYTITHSKLTENSYPVCNLILPTDSNEIYIQGVYNIINGQFTVVLSEVPSMTGYSLTWISFNNI